MRNVGACETLRFYHDQFKIEKSVYIKVESVCYIL